MSSSAVAVLRSACYALRRPPFPRALIENSSTRRFYSSADCTVVAGKPRETNKAAPATVEDDGVSRKVDGIIRALDAHNAAWEECLEQAKFDRLVRRIVFAGSIAGIFVKLIIRRTKEDKEEMSAGNN